MIWLYIIYILSVILPSLLVFIGKNNKTVFNVVFYVTLAIVIAIPIVIKITKVNELDSIGIASFIYSSALSIICVYYGHIIRMQREYKEIEEKISNQMENFVNHPILESKQYIDGVITSMFNLPRSKRTVLRFFTMSLRDIQGKGAVRIDVSFSQYTELLGFLMKDAEKVVGTFTKMPSVIMKSMSKNKKIKEYINTLKKYKGKIDRICVLEQEEISQIITNEANNEGELAWFAKNVPSKRIKWTETRAFLSDLNLLGYSLGNAIPSALEHMVDFAIFDDIFLRWSAPDDSDHGVIIMLIGEEAKKLRESLESYMESAVYGYTSFMELSQKM